MSHRRSIVGNEGFSYSKQFSGAPSNITVPLDENGIYTITLTTTDNENNSTTEEFKLIVSDPVAIIKQSPENGTTSTTYKFDASTSYSLTSSLKLYTWEVFNENGDKISTSQGKTLSKQFIKP
ncbi:hypothetical protein IJM86_02810 [bacterium]|nr:hypothetical protein [bacterium]